MERKTSRTLRVARAAKAILARRRDLRRPALQGKVVAVDCAKGNCFVGENPIEAADEARRAGARGPLYFHRIGDRALDKIHSPWLKTA